MAEPKIGNKYRHSERGQVGTATAVGKDTFIVKGHPMELMTVQLTLDPEFLSFPHDGHHQDRWYRVDWLTPLDPAEAAEWEVEKGKLAAAKMLPEQLGQVTQAVP